MTCNNVIGQVAGGQATDYVNVQLRDLFSQISTPNPQPSVFYDQCAHFIDTAWYDYNVPDTVDQVVWSLLYDELWCGHYDTTAFERVDSVYSRLSDFGSDTVIVSLIDYTFCRLKDSAFGDTTFFNVDTVGPTLIDNPYRQSEPYRFGNVFSASCYPEVNSGSELVFRVDPAFLFVETGHYNNYRKGDWKLEINFNDGNGWQNIDPSVVSHFPVQYAQGYEHAVSVRRLDVADPNNNGNSVARVAAPPFITYTLPSYKWFNIGGMTVDVYPGCDVLGAGQPDKFVILVPGFDIIETPRVKKKYEKYIHKSGLGDLRNHGYTFLVVNWRDSQDPTIDNAMRLVDLIDFLKCNHLDPTSDFQHQFIIMGNSSGALMARYALAWMEQNPNNSPCFPDLVHNTRLYLSVEGEHQGAYIPLAAQEYYAASVDIDMGLPQVLQQGLENRLNVLQTPAARELLLAHYTENNNGNYGITPERQQLLDDFDNLGNGGYPQNVKMMAITNGLITGEHQTGIGDVCVMEPNDAYLVEDSEMDMVVLGIPLRANESLLEIRAIQNGQDFFTFEREEWRWRLELDFLWVQRCFGPFNWTCIPIPFPVLDVVFENTLDENVTREANGMIEWDVMPGGRMSGSQANIQIENELLQIEVFGLGLDIGTQITNPGGTLCGEYEITNRLSNLNFFNSQTTTQSLSFCFAPVVSCFDYRSDVADPDIFNTPVPVMMGNTPFDVIVGEVNGLPGYPQPQIQATFLPSSHPGEVSYPSLNRNHVTLINHLMPDEFMVNDVNNTLLARYLNREIGDEEIFLDNFRVNRNIIVQAEYDMTAGVNTNPMYEYEMQGAQNVFTNYGNAGWPNNNFINPFGYNMTNNGIFARSNPLHIENNGNAELRSDNMPIDNGITTDPFGWFQLVSMPQWVCVEEDFSDNSELFKHNPDQNLESEEISKPSLYPNPIHQNQAITLAGLPKGAYSLLLLDLNGRTILPEFEVELESNQHLEINLPSMISSGTYILKIRGNEMNTFKITVL